MRLIDLDEAIKLLRGKCVAKYPTTFSFGLFAAADELAKLPTVDAVPVVRCKDCQWYAPNNDGSWCGCAIDTSHPDNEPKLDDFCSYGERRTDDA
ncbi:MAG: hypothetical protein E7467_06120 [Ruminococcaceae bacterium]|nr:hypothetical protein [Oscillospiraceae bacterium]